MAKILGFRIRNFRMLRDVSLGSLLNEKCAGELTRMTAVIGESLIPQFKVFFLH